MARPKKKQIEKNSSSLIHLMQEIYNECVEQRAFALRILKQQRSLIEDISDVAQIGRINNDLMKIVDSSIEKKLSLAKLQKDIVNTNDPSFKEEELSDTDKEMLKELSKKMKSEDKNDKSSNNEYKV